MAARAKVTPNLFNAVKLLIDGWAKVSEVCKYMGISTWTYNAIRKSENIDEYKSLVAELNLSKKKTGEKKNNIPDVEEKAEEKHPAVVHQSVTVQATHYMMEKLDKIIELLTVMNNKVGFVVDELTGIPGGKKDG